MVDALITLVVNKVEKDVYNDKRPCPSDAGRAVHDDRARVDTLLLQGHLLKVHILQEAQHSTGVMGDTVVRPRLEVELEDVPATF